MRILARARRVLTLSLPATVGFGLITFWILLALLAPWIAPYPPNAQDFAALAAPEPSTTHLLGTDHLGRDILSRIIWGGRTVLTVAPLSVASALLVGCTMGLYAGYFGGVVDTLISRASDVVLSFPVLFLYIILITKLGPSALNIVLAVTISSAPSIGRITRSLVLTLRASDYVAAAKLRGESNLYVMVVEILPNARGPLIVDACLRMGYAIIAIGVLGFLGLGLPPPDPDWGGMVKDATSLMLIWPHMALFPSAALVSLVVGFNLLADGLREISIKD